MNIRRTILLTIIFLTATSTHTGCSREPAASSLAASYTAGHCELFIDKVLATRPYTSHAPTFVEIYVKTLNHRLDAPIKEIGFRNAITSLGDRSTDGIYSNAVLSSFAGSADYWKFTATIHNGIEPYYASYQGAFYVKTANNTTYWLNGSGGSNFVIDYNGYNNIVNEMGVVSANGANFNQAVSTQDRFSGYYNPANCR